MSSLFQSPPDRWQRTTLRHLVEGPKNGAWGSEAGEDEIDAVCVRVADFDWSRLALTLDDPTIRSFKKQQFKNLHLRRGDIVIEKSGGGEKTPVGRVVLFDEDVDAVTSNFAARIRPHESVCNRFVLYLLAAQYMSGYSHQFIKQNTGIQNLDDANLFRSDVWIPDLPTQRAIADFLDRETARIDALIEKKQRLVELLREKVRATITEALSKGVGHSAPLKSTGLEWLPEVPCHWTVQPLRTLIWYQEGPGILAVDFHEEGVPLLRIKGLSGRKATLEGCNYLDPEKVKTRWNHFRVDVGDYLISASATTGGIATEVTAQTSGAVPYTGIIRVKSRPNGYLREIIPMFLLSTLFEEQIMLLSAGSTIQHFGPSHLSQMKAPLPPASEQKDIANRLSTVMARIEMTTARASVSIDRLKEYRSALITSAVTGQIDVTAYRRSGMTERHIDKIEEAASA